MKTMVGALMAALAAAGTAAAADCSLAGDAVLGKAVSNQCKTCHVFESDKPSRPTAPNIHDVFGKKAVTRKDFPGYSESMTAASGKGLAWAEDRIFDYLADPKAFLNKFNGSEMKNAMFFHLKDEQKRTQVIAFLKEIKGKPECN